MRASHKIRRAVAAAALAAAVAVPAAAQTGWTLRASAADTTLVLAVEGPDPGAAALDLLHQSGRLRARIDSLARDTVFATAGEAAVVQSLDVVGAEALEGVASRVWVTEAGDPFHPRQFGRDLQALAAAYAQAGYAAAQIVPDVQITDEGRSVDIVVRVDEGEPSPVVGVELVGGRGSGRAFASRVTGVRPGTAATDLDAERVRQSLDATGLYAAIGEPVLARTDAGDLVLQVPVTEAPPGTFDAVLGFLPPAGGAPAQVVGSGRVDLRNVFGGGRVFRLELVRNPGLVSTLDVEARDPFVLGSPIGLGVGFEGTSQDSTFARQRLELDLAYPLTQSLTLTGSLTGQTIRPGAYGAGLVDGRPRVRRADALYVGAGIEYVAVDAPRNPSRGLALALSLERGRPRRSVAGDAPLATEADVQNRLSAEVRGYLPTVGRQSLVLGLDAFLVRGGVAADAGLDEAELFRIGGARSLRGYDENAFLGSTVGRLLAEYRLRLDAVTYAFAFGDLGYVDRPALPGLVAEERVLPGYGAGVQLQTGIGLASISYALNPDLPLGRGKVHVGLAVGL